MSTVTGQLGVSASVSWTLRSTSGAYTATSGPNSHDYSVAPDAATYTEILVTSFTVAASGSHSLDLLAFTSLLNQTIAATGVRWLLIKATGNTGKMTLAPGASNGINFWLAGTTPTLTLDCGPDGCAVLLADGVPRTLDATHKTIDVSNPGSVTITVTVSALVKTT